MANVGLKGGSDRDGEALRESVFGDDITSSLTPLVSIKATYGILDNVETFTDTGGSASVVDNQYACKSGTSVGGYGTIWSRKPVAYYAGLGCECRITARFTTGIADSLQIAGMFTAADGMMFGYNGADFGIMHRYGGEFEIRTLTISAAASGAETVTVTLNGVAYTADVTAGTTAQNATEIANGLIAGAANSLWYIQQVGSTVVFVYRGIGARSSTYSISSTGTCAGSFAQNNAGVDPTESWVLRDAWDINPSWLDVTKGNLYRVEFAYLGFGHINYYVMHPETNNWVKVHSIKWPNSETQTNFSNPSFRVGWASASLGSSGTDLTVYGGSGMMALQGNPNENKRNFGAVGNNSMVTTETQILSVKIRRNFGDKFCNALSYPSITVGTDSTKGMIFRVYLNPTVAGVTNYAYVDETESIALYDVSGTTVSGGSLIGAFTVGTGGNKTITADTLNKILISGDEIVVTGEVTSGSASGGFVTINTNEIV